ncbi:MAG: hypothetical protein ACKVWV_05275 [Planctomycetota bacterium]
MIALLAAVVLVQGHPEMVVGRNAENELAIVVEGEQPFRLPASRFVGIEGYSDGAPGFRSLAEPTPDGKLVPIDPASNIEFVFLGADEGLFVFNDRGTGYMKPGEVFKVGTPFFDTHPVWNLPKGDSKKTYSLKVRLRDSTKKHKDSAEITATFAPDDATALYACPMRCPGANITTVPAMCDVCGMRLKLFSAKSYGVRIEPQTELRAGTESKLVFHVETPDGKTVPDLEVVHEKLVHLLMVSSDLSWFAHEHPELQPDGRFTLPFAFPYGGHFTLFNDFTPKSSGMQVVPVELEVAGDVPDPIPLALTARTIVVDGYTVTLDLPKPMRSIQTLSLAVTIAREGKPVTDLEPFLGAMGHLIVIRDDRKQFVHSHPLDGPKGAPGSSGPKVVFSAQFAAPGRYKAWAQFQHKGRVLTTPFVFDVVSAF